jgi:hypothetical protein
MKSNMLRFMLSFILSVVAAYAFAQKSSKEPTLATESIVGKWQLQKVYAGSREISNNPNATTQSWIEFKPDGTYEQSADDGDRGTYRLNEDQSIVYLESSEEKQTKSVTTVNMLNEFELSIRDGVMVLTAKGDGNSGSTKYVYSKGTEQQ